MAAGHGSTPIVTLRPSVGVLAMLTLTTVLLATLVPLIERIPPALASPVESAVRGISTPICQITDDRATELSGLVATASGYVAINDSRFDPAEIRILYLDNRCRVTRTVRYPTPARDPEDLAMAKDGTLWVADVGDNNLNRTTIALWRISPGEGSPVIHRLRYPDGAHDAEALLITDAGTPIVVTKEVGGAGLYQPTQALQAGTALGVPLERVGQFRPAPTGLANPLGTVGETLVTGAAIAPDRRRVALRTYAAAYEWDVSDGNLVAAITNKTPRRTPLPDDPQGEAITYTADGTAFLTVSDESGPTTLRRYPPSTELAPAPSPTGSLVGGAEAAATSAGLTAIPLWYGVAATLIGTAFAVVTFVMVRRGRRPARHRARR